MSVLVSKRNLSSIQYVQSFLDLNDSFRKILGSVSKRRQPYICRPIRQILSKVYNLIIEVSDNYFRYGIKLKDKQEQAQTIIDELLSLQKPLLVLWYIEDFKESKMRMMTDTINQEIFYVAKMGGITEERMVKVANWHDAIFLSNMAELVKIIHSKVIHLPFSYRESTGYNLVDLANKALSELFEANRDIPTTKTMYEIRTSHISTAINTLKAMEYHMYVIFAALDFSEKEMVLWTDLLVSERKLLNSLLKSDRKRFCELK